MEQLAIVETVSDIGELVKKRRAQLGLNQKDAAGLLGVGVRFLSELERGKETLSIGKVMQVVKGFKLAICLKTTEADN